MHAWREPVRPALSNAETHGAVLFSGAAAELDARSPFRPVLQLKRGPSDHSHRPLSSVVAFCRYEDTCHLAVSEVTVLSPSPEGYIPHVSDIEGRHCILRALCKNTNFHLTSREQKHPEGGAKASTAHAEPRLPSERLTEGSPAQAAGTS